MTNTLRIKLCKRLKAVLKSIGQVIGITDTPKDSHRQERSQSNRRRRKNKVKASNKQPRQQSTPQKVIATPNVGVKDALLFGTSLRELNRQADRTHEREKKEDLYYYEDILEDELLDDGFYFLDDDLAYHNEEDELLNDDVYDVYDEDYSDYHEYPFIDDDILPSEDFDEY